MARGPVARVRIVAGRGPSPMTAASSRSEHDTAGHDTAGGDDRTRTDDPLLAKQVLYQLSYVPGLRARSPLRPESIGQLPAEVSAQQDVIPTAAHALVPG